MNPQSQLYQSMMQAQQSQDPMAAQQAQMSAYHPSQMMQPQGQGQVGMSIQGMQNAVMARKMKDAQQVDALNAQGGL